MNTGRTNGIDRIAAAAGTNRAPHQHGRQQPEQVAAAGAAEPSRALVPVGASTAKTHAGPKAVLSPIRGSAAFVTQLIASEIGVESMRARRRAAPDFAAAAYAASAERPLAYRPQRTLGSL